MTSESRSTVLKLTLAIVTVAANPITKPAEAVDELFPPNAKPGGCYARVFVPPSYVTETESVLKRDGYERIEIEPAKYTWEENQVMVKGASTRLEVIPAGYEWLEEQVTVKEASKVVEQIPAEYAVETEQVLDTPEHTVWKKGSGPIEQIDHHTGEIMCLVKVPATYKTVTRRVLKSKATTREIEIPAEYKTVRRSVMKTPPSTREVEIPAAYETVRVQKMVSPPVVRRIGVEPEYQTVTKSHVVGDGEMAWRAVLCETNMTHTTIQSIQSALRAAGNDPGPIDGIIGTSTMEAMRAFQTAKGLPAGHVTHETLQALGIRVDAM